MLVLRSLTAITTATVCYRRRGFVWTTRFVTLGRRQQQAPGSGNRPRTGDSRRRRRSVRLDRQQGAGDAFLLRRDAWLQPSGEQHYLLRDVLQIPHALGFDFFRAAL